MVIALSLLAGAAISAGSAAQPADPSPISCAELFPASVSGGVRGVEPGDLVELRDIGMLESDQLDARQFTLSADGSRAAFQLRRADPRGNGHCLAMLVLDLRSGAAPVIVDRGGELVRATVDFRGKAGFPTGIPVTITPRWSPDGRWIAFLKRVDGITQVWRASSDGGGSEKITEARADVEDFRIIADGGAILFTSRPALSDAREAVAREGRTGFHYDDRWAAMAANRPFPAMPVARAHFVLDLATGQTRIATAAEVALFEVRESPAEDVWTSARSAAGRRARVGPAVPGRPDRILRVESEAGSSILCESAACAGARRPWWSADGRRVRYFRREGWAGASTAIYEWSLGASAPRRLYLTDDVLADCAPRGDGLVCLREGSLTPRRLEHLELPTGRRTLLFNPNPEFDRLRLGRVERLRLTNDFGLPSIADLVLPTAYVQGRRYPLIVVQYDTRGFLRGGTGDEYPIQAFAARGYAVLSVGRPASVATGIADPAEAGRIDLAGFADRRSTLSTVELGVKLLVERGIADPRRVGLTGMSNGATTATYALLHSDLFAAVAMSQCCFDTTLPTRVGPAAARHFYAQGYPRLTDDGEAFWGQISLARNARRVTTPILLQLADDEMMSALESYTALREVGAPIDMFVFPGEHHVKWQPAHRLAVYERSLDWFDYWLRGIRSPAPQRQVELIHWDQLRLSANGASR